ncbi:hypothetical protein GCM10019016_011610 [Streptomyces prasinosporus]|uniref:Uncharacterized protein n=1 Tax=Streptomyces prasinosporus TaxID=68256 RepID=A0ABP6TFV0_9ACTN|nr:hypothetical protein GCM10010332_67640 [Streptomyces albogriseolus]
MVPPHCTGGIGQELLCLMTYGTGVDGIRSRWTRPLVNVDEAQGYTAQQ